MTDLASRVVTAAILGFFVGSLDGMMINSPTVDSYVEGVVVGANIIALGSIVVITSSTERPNLFGIFIAAIGVFQLGRTIIFA